jgi:SAM-dependent methyltransferase
VTSVVAQYRPEAQAGGILRDDGEIHFFTRVNALLRPDMTVLDFGAGRGHIFLEETTSYRTRLSKIQGKVRAVVGVDVDDGILKHPFLDKRIVVQPGSPLPIEDSSIDVLIAHWVLEHITDPKFFETECLRILKPGGWICARTPHRWGYIGLIANFLPDKLQRLLLRHIRPSMEDEDKFPTVYKLNTKKALSKYFDQERWENFSYGLNSTPRYHFNSRIIFSLFEIIHAVFRPEVDVLVLIRKRK